MCRSQAGWDTSLTGDAVGRDVVAMAFAAHGGHRFSFQLAFNRSVFTTLLLSWNYVKTSNRAAAEALQREIDKMQKKTESLPA